MHINAHGHRRDSLTHLATKRHTPYTIPQNICENWPKWARSSEMGVPWGTPSSLDGLFHEKSIKILRKWMRTGGSPISGNLQISSNINLECGFICA